MWRGWFVRLCWLWSISFQTHVELSHIIASKSYMRIYLSYVKCLQIFFRHSKFYSVTAMLGEFFIFLTFTLFSIILNILLSDKPRCAEAVLLYSIFYMYCDAHDGKVTFLPFHFSCSDSRCRCSMPCVFMPSPAISLATKGSLYSSCLVCMCLSVCDHIKESLWEFHQIYNFGAARDTEMN